MKNDLFILVTTLADKSINITAHETQYTAFHAFQQTSQLMAATNETLPIICVELYQRVAYSQNKKFIK